MDAKKERERKIVLKQVSFGVAMGAVQSGHVVKKYDKSGAKIEIYKDSSGMFGALITFPNGYKRSNGQDFQDQASAEKYADKAATDGALEENERA